MKNSNSYKEERAEIIEKMEAIVNSAEGRELSSDESTTFDSLNEKVEELNKTISRAKSFENLQATKVVKEERENTPKEMKNYSFQEAMRQAYNGKLEGLVAEMDQEARIQSPNQSFRGIAIPASVLETRNVATGNVNATEVMSFTDQLIASSVLVQAGAEMYTGINNAKFPIVDEIASTFVAEFPGSDTAAAGVVNGLTLTPNKCMSVVNMSVESLTQNDGLEAAIRRNIAMSLMAELESNLLASADAAAGPTSIFADATDGGSTLDAAALLAAETTVLNNNVNPALGKLAYLVNGDALGIIKGLAQVTGVSPIYDNMDKLTNSYPTFVSSLVGNKATNFDSVLFGDFSKVKLAQFGGLDILFDPYTLSAQGIGRMVAAALLDGNAVQTADAFVQIETAA